MRVRGLLAFLFSIAIAAAALAQNKVSGSLQCGKPDPSQKVDIGDRPDHALTIGKVQCTWTKGIEIAGSQAKEGVSASTGEVTGNKESERGVHFSTFASGDKAFVRFQGSLVLKDGAPQSSQGTWSFTGGTGKLKGLKGKGTYKGTPAADGSLTFEIEGESSIP